MSDCEGKSQERQYSQEHLVVLWGEYMIDGARYGDVADVKEALQNSANVDAVDSSGRSALHMAAANGHHEVAHVLLEAGANTELKNDVGSTPLHWACVSGSLPIVKLLLSHGASPAVVNDAGQSPLDEALENEEIRRMFEKHMLQDSTQISDDAQEGQGGGTASTKLDGGMPGASELEGVAESEDTSGALSSVRAQLERTHL
jgi:hypothetical protein